MNTEETFLQKMENPGPQDMVPYMLALRTYASRFPRVVEFGVRSGNSTAAFLAGGATVTSYDIREHTFVCPDDAKDRWTFHLADTRQLTSIPACDLLFIDTAHTRGQVEAELTQAKHVHGAILLHDFIVNCVRGEEGQPGIGYAVLDFLANNPDWKIVELFGGYWGLLVLGRK